MIRRPINEGFNLAVLDGTKTTTIRLHPWPVGVPIQLYNWSGAAYRSMQEDVAVVEVISTHTIWIQHRSTGFMEYDFDLSMGSPIWKTEGFDSQDEMDEWFRKVVPKGQLRMLNIMRFRQIK